MLLIFVKISYSSKRFALCVVSLLAAVGYLGIDMIIKI